MPKYRKKLAKRTPGREKPTWLILTGRGRNSRVVKQIRGYFCCADAAIRDLEEGILSEDKPV